MPKTAPLQQNYRLADHVRACHVDGQVILLDLWRDRYIGVGGALLPALSSRIADWPLKESASENQSGETQVDSWIASMSMQEILTPAVEAPPRRVGLAEPQQSLFACQQPPWDGMQWQRILNVARATFIAGHWLKRHRLAEIAVRVERLRAAGPSDPTCDGSERLHSAVSWYLKTRPFVMTSHDECLRDSLTMLRFLAAEKLYPQWVIGVRTRPFAAHSWLQAGSLVLNDLHETVRGYTPILIV